MKLLRKPAGRKVAALLLAFASLALFFASYTLFSDDGGRYAGSDWGAVFAVAAWATMAGALVLAVSGYLPPRRIVRTRRQ